MDLHVTLKVPVIFFIKEKKNAANKLKDNENKLERIPSSIGVRLKRPRCARVWDQLPVVLWSEEVVAALEGADAAGLAEEELIPLEVLTELCWMASF